MYNFKRYDVMGSMLKNNKHTRLMSRFNHSYGESSESSWTSPFDMLLVTTFRHDESNSEDALVVVNKMPREFGPLIRGNKTMTEYKKSIDNYYVGQIKEEDAVKKYEWPTGETFLLQRFPSVLRAATDSDKDFRKEYRNGMLMYEGNNYGDTSNFYIIGTLLDVQK